jgi:plastocyanin
VTRVRGGRAVQASLRPILMSGPRRAARPFAVSLALALMALAWSASAGGSATNKTTVDGLTVTLTAAPARTSPGTTVRFLASASTQHATGALGYGLSYGDGRSAAPVAIPDFCLAGPGRPAQQSWRFTHSYRAPGRYQVRLNVYVNCGGQRASVAVTVIVRR